ncbi:MAG: ABC transporter permease subunit [Lachnospiraceae bacterium]|nr:ABC transporter permease subunit [Lachnospiraceae bacterium]
MKIRLNPIVKKDLQVSVRSMRISWGLFVYELLLALAFLLAVSIIQSESRSYYSNNIYSYLIYLFPVVAVVQLGIVALIVPIITASSISGERERQTFDIMLTTCMSPFSIVFGKVTSAVIRILFFVLASTPIMALAFVVGGLSWFDLFTFILTILMMAFFTGSIGIFCSAVCRKAISAVILSFVFYLLIFGGTFVPGLIHALFAFSNMGNEHMGESLLALLFNPIMFFEEYFVTVMTGEGLLADASVDLDDVGPLTYLLSKGHTWIFVSAFCIIALSFLFMAGAAWKVNPLHSSGGKKPGKKKAGQE